MDPFPVSRSSVPVLVVLDEVGSTNDALMERAASPDAVAFTTVVTTNQTSGRGRRDRVWTAPPGSGLAVSVLLAGVGDLTGWLPLVAGLSMRDAVAELLPHRPVALKWPNDVLVEDRKICGILAGIVGTWVVVGAGLNVRLTREQLPVATATALVMEGADDGPSLEDRALDAYLRRLRQLVEALSASGPELSGIRAAVRRRCDTVGRDVRVELPDGAVLMGTAVDLAEDGRLVVRTVRGRSITVAAGDVVHLRAT
jgi:BirA family transcriptional regulator, biotin operon repressor / biotin---[acetyl-CoA-carboxylase] ligase